MMKPRLTALGCVATMLCGLIPWANAAARLGQEPARTRFHQPAANLRPDLFVWTDTCNVYVVREGDAALLIDLGDGSVLDHLAELGVRQVEWVLFTHHHREQCQGAPRLKGTGAKVAAPEAERALFERPTDFRKMNVSLGDAFTIHGSSYVRPPVQPIPLDRTFKTNDAFTWRGREFRCVDTRGNSPGSMTYLLRHPGDPARSSRGNEAQTSSVTQKSRSLVTSAATNWLAFAGDVMLDGAKMHMWFDTEWDYGFAAGIQALRKSVARLADLDTAWLLPSHGPAVREPKKPLLVFGRKLARLEKLYVRGYGVEGASAAYQDKVSRPTVVSNVWQVSPHLFKFKRPNFWPNFGLILSDSGRALVVDCGLLDEKFLDTALDGMRRHFGLKAIGAVVITHMHGDHFLEAPHLRETWGAPIWALDNMVDKMEHPERFDYAAPIQAYGKRRVDGSSLTGVRLDRVFKSGETFDWEGHRFTVDWMPGQTEFALCLHGRIDGRKVAFTGDNIFGDPDDPKQTGHEAMVAHNSAILEEGYIYGAEYLKRLKPDILIGGHSFVMDRPAKFIERYRRWSYEMRDAFQALSPDQDYRYWFDPFWVRAEPYRVSLRPGASAEVSLHIRNFRRGKQRHRIEIHPPAGLVAEPSLLEGHLGGESRGAFPFRLKAAPGADGGVCIVAFDVTLDGHRYGERSDLMVEVKAAPGVPRRGVRSE
jgi:glyoxylase-like metal-dependent hydrolase (beta-lactamase superfamily II)